MYLSLKCIGSTHDVSIASVDYNRLSDIINESMTNCLYKSFKVIV